VVCRRVDGAAAAAGFAGIKLPLVEAIRLMPVFEIGDLIMGEVRPAAASSLAAAGLFEALSGLADGPSGRAAGTDGYILGVMVGTAPLSSPWLSKSPSGSLTKSYPGH
jgi:urease accessory protein